MKHCRESRFSSNISSCSQGGQSEKQCFRARNRAQKTSNVSVVHRKHFGFPKSNVFQARPAEKRLGKHRESKAKYSQLRIKSLIPSLIFYIRQSNMAQTNKNLLTSIVPAKLEPTISTILIELINIIQNPTIEYINRIHKLLS